MTQIANILAVAAVSIGLWTLLSIVDSQRRGGLIHERGRNCDIKQFQG